jgi:ribosomal protein S18 acetylase RimI-like enzyme
MVNIRLISAEETYPIRREALRKNIDLPYKLKGDFDKDTLHLGVFVNDDLVSIVTLIKKSRSEWNDEQFQLRGMATIAKHRGKGYGKLLALKSEEYLIGRKNHKIWCNARVEAIGFYKTLNYSVLGEAFMVPKVGMHYLMFKEF